MNRQQAVIHFLGLFDNGGPPCCLCGVPGWRAVWLCRGSLLCAAICDEHAKKIPRTAISVDDLFGRYRGCPDYSPRAVLRHGGRVRCPKHQ